MKQQTFKQRLNDIEHVIHKKHPPNLFYKLFPDTQTRILDYIDESLLDEISAYSVKHNSRTGS